MNFAESVRAHAKKVAEIRNSVKTEEATKTALIMPFFQNVLGYDIFNPAEFVPEDSAVMDKTKWGQIDYCIHLGGLPVTIIEAKHAGASLEGSVHQLCKYFASSDAAFAILTNGVEYRFYTDTEKENLMDITPFLAVNLLAVSDEQMKLLELFRREDFDGAEVYDAAEEARHMMSVKASLEAELSEPSDDFVRVIISPFYKDRITKQALDKFRPYVKASIAKITANTGGTARSSSDGDRLVSPTDNGWETAFTEVVRGVLTGAGISDKSFYSRIKSEYFYASYRKCQICLFHYNEYNLAELKIQFLQPFMEAGCDWKNREHREAFVVTSASDVRKYADRIVAAAHDVDEMWREYSRKKKQD